MLTDHQQKIRSRHVTASELPAIMGADSYRGAVDVWLAKTGRVAPQESNEAMELGHAIEPALLDWCGKELGAKITRKNLIRTNGVMSCTRDGYVVMRNEGVQAKTSGIIGPRPLEDEWGEPGTDQVPNRVIVQVMAEMAVDGTERTWIPALIGGVGRRLYVVERDEKMIELVQGWAEWFWGHVERDEMPTGAPRIETLKRLIREPGKVVEVDENIVAVWKTAREMRLNTEKLEDEAERNLLAALGDAEGWTSAAGDGTYLETVRKGYTVGESRYRTLRLKNPNKEIADGGHRCRKGFGSEVPTSAPVSKRGDVLS